MGQIALYNPAMKSYIQLSSKWVFPPCLEQPTCHLLGSVERHVLEDLTFELHDMNCSACQEIGRRTDLTDEAVLRTKPLTLHQSFSGKNEHHSHDDAPLEWNIKMSSRFQKPPSEKELSLSFEAVC